VTVELWYAATFAAAFFLSVPLVLLAERAGVALGFVDHPRPNEVQRRIIPRTGGYAVFLAFWLAILLSFILPLPELERLEADNWRLLGVLLGSLALLPLAFADDSRRLGPAPQFAFQVMAAIIPTFFGLRMEEIATPLGIISVPNALAAPLAVLWIVAMINAINLLDTMDGLAGGVTAITCAVLFTRTMWFDQTSIAVLPLALGAACTGFLTRNWHPSHVILGSSGSLFLGYLLGVITLVGGVKIGTAFLVLAVPILDVAWVIYRRVSTGRSPFHGGDAQHLPHRLRLLGLSDRRIVLSLYAVCGLLGAAVLAMHSVLPTMQKAVLATVVVAAVTATLAIVARLTAAASSQTAPPSVAVTESDARS